MQKLLFILTITLLISISLYSQNWYTFAGSNGKNGLTEMTGPVSISTPYWTVNSSTSSVWGNAIYTFGDKFATARTVFTPAYRGKIELRNLTDGSLNWEQTFADTSVMYLVGFTEDAVYAADYRSTYTILYALTVDSGNVMWSFSTYMFPGNTGICFANNGDPIIMGKRLDRLTGIPKWTNNYYVPVGPEGGYVINNDNNTYYHWTGLIGAPIKLIAIDLTTGVTKYESDGLPGDADQENDLVIGPDGTIYITRDGNSGSLWAFTDTGTGFAEKWHLTPGVLVKSIGPDNVLYCADRNNGLPDGPLMRVDGNLGIVIGYVTPSTPATYVSVGYDSTVYVATGEAGSGRYFAYTPDLQTIKWQLNVPYNYYSGCPIGREGVFITSGSGTEIRAYKPNIIRKSVADFRSSGRDIIASIQTVSYFDQSSYAPTFWQWTFEGGTPNSSTLQNPADIQYTTPGIYSVQLIATNSFGADTIVRTKYVHVGELVGLEDDQTIVSKYKLEQNYPNPFNPSTRIKYTIPSTEFVSLKVYDILGNEITTLVSEEKSIGTYEVNWNAVDLPSGIYFCKLSAGNFIQTRKMTLLK
jgi:hypothetical protein